MAEFYRIWRGTCESALPTMSIDIWLEIGEADVHRVIDLLPSLAWQGSLVGLSFVPQKMTRNREHSALQLGIALEPVLELPGKVILPQPQVGIPQGRKGSST